MKGRKLLVPYLMKSFEIFLYERVPYIFFQMFEPPVSLIESKKQKAAFDDVEGSKVIGYFEKDSEGKVTENLPLIQRVHSTMNLLRAFFGLISRDEGLTLEISAFLTFHGGNSTFINSFDKTKSLFSSLPPTQHHSFFRKQKFIFRKLKTIRYSIVAGFLCRIAVFFFFFFQN